MSDEDLRKLMERMSVDLERATPGPWKIGSYSQRCVARQTDRSHKHDGTKADTPCVWVTEFYECEGDGYSMGIAAEGGKMVVSADYTSVEIRMDDARHIVNCSPDNVRALLDAMRRLEDVALDLQSLCDKQAVEIEVLRRSQLADVAR